MLPATVYFASPRQHKLDYRETLPAKLDLILERLNLRERVKDELVCLKIHAGANIGYSTIHPVFVRKVVKAIQDAGGKVFVADVNWGVAGAETRGYTPEVLGCPIYPAAGPADRYFYTHHHPYKAMTDWKVAGMVEDATFLVNFAHAKGHPSCSYGGAFKNLALGCVVGETRSAMHDVFHHVPYWFPELCPDQSVREQIQASCPRGAIVWDKQSPTDLHLRGELCNNCGRCLQVAPPGSLRIDPANFTAFQEACAISTALTLGTFAPGKATHLVLATQLTPVCDCFGFTGMAVFPDVGLLASDDIVALDTAVLDLIAQQPLLDENVPTSMEIRRGPGHPLTWIHGALKDPYTVTRCGEALGLGASAYDLVDVMPLDASVPAAPAPISAR